MNSRIVLPGRLVALLLVLMATPLGALGQGLPMLPNPITSDDLMAYADRLDLSIQQRLGMLPMHDSYLERFRRLRDGDMQKFEDAILNLVATINPMDLKIPPRKDLEDILHQFNRLLSKVQQVDRTLFNEMQTFLTESQMLALPRVRYARERSMYEDVTLDIAGEFNDGARVDLVTYLEDLELSSEAKLQIDPILRSYETEMLSRVKDLHDEIENGLILILDVIDELGLRDMTIEEFAELGVDENFFQTIMNIFNEASQPFQKAVSKVSKLNLDTWRRISSLLNEKQRREVRYRYFRRAYREAVRQAEGVEAYFRLALGFTSLTDEQRTQIALERDSHRRRDGNLSEEIATLLEKSRKYRTIMQMGGEEFGERQEQMIDSSQARADKYQTIMQMEGEELKEFEERREQMIDSSRARADKYQTIMQMEGEELGEHDRKIEDLSERREQMIDSTRARVDGILGLRLAARLALEEEGGTPDESDQESTVIVNGGGNDHAIQIERLSMDISEPETETDSYLPLPIGAGRINEYARRLGLAIEQGSILQSFYDDYRSGYDELLLDANSEEVSSTDEDPLSDARQRLERAKRRESRYEAIRVLDDDFFDQVSLLVDSDDQDARLESLRQERRRESASRGLTSWIQRFTDHDEALIDVPALVRGLEFSTEQSNRVLSALDEHNDALSATYEESTPIVLDHMRLRALGRALDEEGGQTPQALDNRIEQRFASLAKNARGLVELNRATIEQLKTLLSESDKWRLVQAYNEKVYPDIYWDDESAMDMFDTALALPDLGGGQHDDIQLIANNYRDQYYDLSDQLVDIASQRNGFEFQGVIPMDLIRRELKGERVKFQRRETSARARARLRILLNDEQTRLMRQIIREKEDEDDEEDS